MKIYRRLSYILITIVLLGCANNPYRKSNAVYKKELKAFSKILISIPNIPENSTKAATRQVLTTNFNLRKPNYVILHHTAQKSCEETLKTFTQQRTEVSAHYLICKDGTTHHLLNDYLRAWHSGISR